MALRGHVFDKQLFSSDCYALVTDTFLGKQSGIIRGCDMTHTTSLIHINEGYFVVKGRPIQEEGGSNIEVEPGNIDGSYCKLVCELDMSKNNTTTELNQVYYKIVEDAANYPVLTQEDITDSGIIYQFELAKFRRTLNGIEDFVDTRSFLNFDSIYEEVRNEIKKIEDGSIFVTEEEMREVGVAVSPTEPITNEKVWIQKGKNLFNRENNILEGYYLSNDGTYISSNGSYVQDYYIEVNSNTEYVLSCNESTGLRVGFFNNEKTFISRETISGTKFYFTTPSNCKYLIISWDDLEGKSIINSIVLEEYGYKKIYVKNDNGIFEEFVNAETMGIETITNSNGTAIKYPNGILICKGYIRVPANTAGLEIPFPMEFKANDLTEINVCVTNVFANSNAIIWTGQANSSKNLGLYPVDILSNATPTVESIANYIAIGRWK